MAMSLLSHLFALPLVWWWPPATDVGGSGRLGPAEWLAYYGLLAALGRSFLEQDAHGNGQLDV
jgi:hypothetical protein